MPTPTPSPTPPPDLTTFGAEVLVAVGLMFIGGAVLALVLLRLARHAPTTLVTVSLSILTLAALLLYGATESEALLGIVGTGLGALAGAVTAIFNDKKEERDETRPQQE